MSPVQASEDWIDNTPIREAVLRAVERDGLTYNEIAQRAGWVRSRPSERRNYNQGETSQLKRRLGMVGEAGYQPSRLIRYELAVKICRAIGRDPWELDI